MSGCLSESDLIGYHAFQLDSAESERIRAHLAECGACLDRDKALVDRHESWVRQLRQAGAPWRCPTEAPRALPQPGMVAGYAIVEEIGRGGQGVVYRAIQKSTKREVALKLLREGPFASRAARKRFEREVELVAALRHPHIVAVFDSGVTADGRDFCVMDFVRGDRLDHFARDRKLGVGDILSLTARVCEAVNFAHQRGVIHRDLKPSNILVEPSGEPKILDFGLAKQSAAAGETLATATSLVAGTLPYLSPEQARGRHEEVDIRSDVYSLGVVLYELLTGRLPYRVDGDLSTVLNAITNTPPTPPNRALAEALAGRQDASAPRRIDDEIETIVLKALAKDRERRYQSAGELARDIRHYLAGEPIEAKRDSGWYVLKKTLRRYRAAIAVGTVFVLIVTGSAVSLAILYGTQARLLDQVKHQKDLAQRAEGLARQRFDDLYKLTGSILFDLDEQVRYLSGATAARQKLVTMGMEYLNRLAAMADANDPVMQAQLGAAFFKLGDVQGDPDMPNLGDPAGALSNYQRGLHYVEATARALPDDTHRQRALATAYNRTGRLLCAMARAQEGQGYYDKAMRVLERLLGASPNNPQLQHDLTFNYEQLAHLDLIAGRVDEAMAWHRRALAMLADARAQRPNDAAILHSVSVSHDKLGRILAEQGKLAEALEEHRRCADALQDCVRLEPTAAPYRRDLSVAHERLGFIQQQRGNPEAALTHFQASLEASRQLAESDARDAKALASLAAAHCRMGEIQLSRGDASAAQASFEAYQAAAKRRLEIASDDPAALRDVAVSHYKLGELHLAAARLTGSPAMDRLGRWRSARQCLQSCREMFEKLRQRGQLAASDANVPAELAAEIASCDAQITALAAADEDSGG